MNNISDMPTVEDLRMIARAAFEEQRGERPASGRGYLNDMAFAMRELTLLDRAEFTQKNTGAMNCYCAGTRRLINNVRCWQKPKRHERVISGEKSKQQ